jgi:hypothetical protein
LEVWWLRGLVWGVWIFGVMSEKKSEKKSGGRERSSKRVWRSVRRW